jgi:hypothetical protein
LFEKAQEVAANSRMRANLIITIKKYSCLIEIIYNMYINTHDVYVQAGMESNSQMIRREEKKNPHFIFDIKKVV